MGLFAWLASRWTPEFEYRDRLADEVEDIAYESTRIGTRRGFLMGVLVGAILGMIGIGAFKTSGLATQPFPTAEPREARQQATSPQPSSEELTLLRKENEQLKGELARAKTAASTPPIEKGVVEPSPPQVKTDVPARRPSKTVAREPSVKSEAKGSPSDSAVAQPIPSNCRREGDCDPVNP